MQPLITPTRDSLIVSYLEKIRKLDLSKEKESEIVNIFSDFSNEIISEPIDYQIKPKVTDQFKHLIENYKLIASNISDLFFVLDDGLRFKFVSPTVEKFLDYRFQELLGKSFDVLIPDWSVNTLKNKIVSTPQHSLLEHTKKFTFQLSSKYGKLTWFEMQITAIYDSQNKLIGYNGICRDINERLKYEEALKKAKVQAEESDKLKSAFLANMSHEIRTPLNGIIGFSTMLNNKWLSDEKKEKYTDFILSCSKQLLTIINDIIDISKIEAKQLTLVNRSVSLHQLCDEIFATAEVELERLDKAEIQLKILKGSDKDIILFIDEIRLKQVLYNLITNALKFTENGFVKFGYTIIEDKEIRFFVKDSGTGISPNIQGSIFDRFRQGDIDRKSRISGTGLGLAICKGIVELLDGKINVISEIDNGSEFFFTLPIAKYLKVD